MASSMIGPGRKERNRRVAGILLLVVGLIFVTAVVGIVTLN